MEAETTKDEAEGYEWHGRVSTGSSDMRSSVEISCGGFLLRARVKREEPVEVGEARVGNRSLGRWDPKSKGKRFTKEGTIFLPSVYRERDNRRKTRVLVEKPSLQKGQGGGQGAVLPDLQLAVLSSHWENSCEQAPG